MTSSFPTVYVDKEDPEYQRLPRNQFVLIPGKQGSTFNDYRRAASILEAAWESKELSESVPHVPANGRWYIKDDENLSGFTAAGVYTEEA